MSSLPVWIQNQLEALLSSDLAAGASNASLNRLLAFAADHQRPFPFDEVAVRHAVFNVASWHAEKSRPEALFSIQQPIGFSITP